MFSGSGSKKTQQMKAGPHHDIRSAYLELSGKGKGPVVSATVCELIEAHHLGSEHQAGKTTRRIRFRGPEDCKASR